MVKCMYINKGLQLTSYLQHNGTWSVAVWPRRRLCYRPAVFSATTRHWSSIPTGKNSARVSKTVISVLLFLLLKPETASLEIAKVIVCLCVDSCHIREKTYYCTVAPLLGYRENKLFRCVSFCAGLLVHGYSILFVVVVTWCLCAGITVSPFNSDAR